VIGQVIGNYRIVGELGRGGMGMVYRAEHVQLGRPAALKMLLPQMSADPSIVQRFFNEARAASAIDHPGIVEVYDFGTHVDGSAYIVMPLLKGDSLETRLKASPVAPLEGATMIVQVLSALAAAHARGIIHRDLKPDNIFLVPNELMPGGIQVKLLDFGIAKLADDKAAGVKTQTGMMIGTPAYMSPEQCMGRPDIDHRTDIYSIGCILYHIACGRPPFLSEHGTGMIVAAQMRDAPADPRTLNPHLPSQLASIILRCLEKEPAARYQSANELKNALVEAGAQGTKSRPPVVSPESYAQTMMPVQGASHVVGPPTTRSGSAGQMHAMTAQAPQKSSRAVIIGVGALLLAIAGIGVGVALNRDGGDKPAVVANEPTAPAVSEPPTQGPVKQEPPKQVAEPPRQVASPPHEIKGLPDPDPCIDGMARSVDTHGNCCWPAQAWSTTKAKCIGAPACPAGMKAKGEVCIVLASTAPPPATSATFKIDAKAYAPEAKIRVTFPGPLSSTPKNRAWVAVSEQGSPATSYGTWEYVTDGATTLVLTAPKQVGRYEVRLHTNYPTKSYNVVHAEKLVVEPGAAPPQTAKLRLSVKQKKIAPGDKMDIVFAQKMVAAPGEKFWVTVTKPEADNNSYGAYEYVPPDAKTMTFEAPKIAGDYEIRLHANYPTKSTNLVHRVKIHVGD
jgi:serine/threonine protein kinase